MEQLSELPPLAIIAFGVTVAIIFVVRHAGLLAGANSRPSSASTAQVAAVIVDPTALNNASAAVRDMTAAMVKSNDQYEDHAHMVCRRIEGLATEVENLNRNLGAMILEMARRR